MKIFFILFKEKKKKYTQWEHIFLFRPVFRKEFTKNLNNKLLN